MWEKMSSWKQQQTFFHMHTHCRFQQTHSFHKRIVSLQVVFVAFAAPNEKTCIGRTSSFMYKTWNPSIQLPAISWTKLANRQVPRQDLAAGGVKNQKEGPHFQNKVLDVCSNRGAKRVMGGHWFQMGGPGTTGPPAGDDPANRVASTVDRGFTNIDCAEHSNV